MKRQLFPCVVCKRHIREDESRCPFCAASPALLGLALLVGACAEPERKEPVYGAPPVPEVLTDTTRPASAPLSAPLAPPVSTPASVPASTPASTPVSAPTAPKKVEVAPKKPPVEKPDRRNVPAYGRPPSPIFDEPKPLYGSPAIPDYNRGMDDEW